MKKDFWFWAAGSCFFFFLDYMGREASNSSLIFFFPSFSLPLTVPGMCSVYNVQSYLGGKKNKSNLKFTSGTC